MRGLLEFGGAAVAVATAIWLGGSFITLDPLWIIEVSPIARGFIGAGSLWLAFCATF